MDDIEKIVHEVIKKVAQEKKLSVTDIQNTQRLVGDIGFKSLDLARVIAILESKLHADPFSKLVPITRIQTVGDLCDAYKLFFSHNLSNSSLIDFNQGKSRAEARLNSSDLKRGELRKKSRMD